MLIREHAFGIIECENRIALARRELTGPHEIYGRRCALCHQDLHLFCCECHLTGREGGGDIVAPVLNYEPICLVHVFPPFQRRRPLVCAGGQPRNGAPRFRFGRPQHVGVACLRISVAPFSLLDESERLTREPA